ncbi:glycoside hydrolase family 113 [Clostridium manihotivorum]|uniref:1,4-beta-xylanase n=1 Tax=Clostridium manihotivorum TaxID=2320868 RepID=A0A3R5QVB4_9CLOT|nr:1,4-beta-xylanase [Clostridium manihotivorum]QAA30311.1 1,4-beta-xylanase [Clostridium manihotivorum]
MDYIKGFTFGFMDKSSDLSSNEGKQSLRLLKERTNSSHVILAVGAIQEKPQSTNIYYNDDETVRDADLYNIIHYARELGLKVILKPILNCKDGTWRAHINFFDIEAPCEPKWSDWFRRYSEFMVHYSKIAEETNCEMLIIGCEMVQTERKDQYWRNLIKDVRKQYNGLISYNTDKYQEGNVSWWDAVDVISSSGYYPIDKWDKELDRIEAIVSPFNKPFFFAEAGCPSRTGSAFLPNDWTLKGDIDLKEQETFYKTMFEKAGKREWVRGFGLWDWKARLYGENDAMYNGDYSVFGKPAEKIVFDFYKKK